MKKLLLKFTLLLMSCTFLLSPVKVGAEEKARIQNPCPSQSAIQLKDDLRILWIDHTIWTRNYIISALAGLKDQDKVLARLKNQDDIGNAIKPYYGEAAGNKLAKLLREHILLAGKVVVAAKSGNQANLKKFNTEWYKNADDIAQFLSSANPNWPNAALKDLLYTHLKFVTDEAVARIKKDWDADILAFDEGEDHIIKMADILAEGIIKQFPNKF
ncbi:glycosyltransferase [Bacillus sp. JJ864]|uniref:glycosyltransferase n=1 Tax=Bacillus sp. JJ864 TaxID=3122975 RepID=UPI002FFF87B8